MSPLTWAFFLLIAAFVLLVVEMFVPSHGIIGAIAAVMVAAAVVAGFYQNATWGVVMLAISAISVPIAVWAVFLYWPQTPIGQRILIRLPESPDEYLPESYRDRKGLIGKIGVAKTKMLLAGAIQIDGKSYDAVSEDLPIEMDAEVQVVAIKMNRIIVRALDPNRPRESSTPPVVGHAHLSPAPHSSTASSPSRNSSVPTPAGMAPEDLLARSAASFGLDDVPELNEGAPEKEPEFPKESDSR
jgi:membrane protein implicated in regulation of membrane protease activity